MKRWVGTNELVYSISYKRGARSVTFSIHGTDYGALPSFPYYNIATPHLEGIYYPSTREVRDSSETSPVLCFRGQTQN
jgi:hypothetical protein